MMNKLIISLILSFQLFHGGAQQLFIEDKTWDIQHTQIGEDSEADKYKEVYFGSIDTDALHSDRLCITIPGLQPCTFEAIVNNDEQWYGRSLNEVNHITLIKESHLIIGSIWIDGKRFEIASLSDSLAVITRLDVTRYADGDDVLDKNIYREDRSAPTGNITAKPCRILVAYTAESADLVAPSMAAFAKLAVETTNQSYSNSGIRHQLELAACVRLNYAGSGNLETDLNRLVSRNDGAIDEIHALRDVYAADLCVLIAESSDSRTGMAAAIHANESNAFCVVDRKAAVSNLSFPHAIGHLQGAKHDLSAHSKAVSFSPTSSSALGYRAAISAKSRKTVMTNGSDSKNGVRTPYWSDAAESDPFGGQCMRRSSEKNNVNILNEETERLKGFRTPCVSVCISDQVIKEGEYGSWIASNDLQSSGFVSVESKGAMVLSAPAGVTLTPGFHAKAGSRVDIVIRDPETAERSDTPYLQAGGPDAEVAQMESSDRNLGMYPTTVSDQSFIRFELAAEGTVTLSVLDFLGNLVDQVLANSYMESGKHEIPFYKKGLPAGVYYVVMSDDKAMQTVKFMIK